MNPSGGTASGIIWASISQGGRIILQLALVAALSRVLPPEDFGLLAMATVVTVFASLIRDMGTAAAVIQKQVVSKDTLDTTFWFNVMVGAALAFVVAAMALPVAVAFREPRLTPVLACLALTFPVTSFGAVHQALLERNLRFRALARIEVGSATISLLAAVAAARAGFGVFSLVLNSMLIAVLTTGQLWWTSAWKPRWHWDRESFRGIWQFGGSFFGFQLLNYFARNADTILIGRVLGAMDVGWYNMAYRIMLFPLTTLSNVFARVLFPVLSHKQRDRGAFNRLYLRSISAIAFVTAPLMLGLWAVRIPFVECLLGTTWLPVAEILGWFSPVGFLQSIITTVGLIYMSTGNTRVMFKWGVVSSVAIVSAMCIGLNWGYLGVARAYALVMVLLAYPAFRIPFRLIGLPTISVIHCIWRPLFCAVIMAVCLIWLNNTIPVGISALARLLLLICAGSVLYLILAGILMRELVRELYCAVTGLGVRVPVAGT